MLKDTYAQYKSMATGQDHNLGKPVDVFQTCKDYLKISCDSLVSKILEQKI